MGDTDRLESEDAEAGKKLSFGFSSVYMKPKTFQKVFPILIVNFVGYVGFSLPLPLFPPMFLDPNLGFISMEIAVFWRNVLLGLLLAAYPLGQFFGCPILGLLSDRYGRRPILMLSLLGIMPTYILSALSVENGLISLLFISRFFCGLLEGNVAIAQAAIADLSSGGKEKENYFGKIVAFASAGFIFSPLLGGKLSDPLFPYFRGLEIKHCCLFFVLIFSFF